MAIIKEKELTSAGKNVEKRKPLHTVGGNVNCCSYYVEQHKDFSKIINRTTMWFSKSSYGYLSEGNKDINLKRYLNPHVYCSIIYNSQDTGVI